MSLKEANSPSAATRYRASRRRAAYNFSISEKEAINIETKTLTKTINIKWSINKQTIDIAKLSSKGEKKGVIETSLKFNNRTFNLELCVPGWRRSQDGFSAFYLTVPRQSKRSQRRSINKSQETSDDYDDTDDANDSMLDNDADTDDEDSEEEETNDFVARYTISFGHDAEHRLSRKSSIRNDFDLGVGFPNFTEINALSEAIYANKLEFDIEVEIFECESTVKDRLFIDNKAQNPQSVTAKLLEKMYYEKQNCDAVIVAAMRQNKLKHIKVHKCILTAASPVFSTFFKHNSQENMTSSVMMKQWNMNTVLTMLKFIYLGRIELDHDEVMEAIIDDKDIEDTESIQGLDEDEEEANTELSGSEKGDYKSVSEEVKCGEEEQHKPKGMELQKLEQECPETARRLFALFQIAECYEIDALSIACCHKLAQYITNETCCILLMYLDKYSHLDEKMRDIKHYILDFIVNHIRTVKKTNGYLYLLQNKPDLLDELIVKITENNTRN